MLFRLVATLGCDFGRLVLHTGSHIQQARRSGMAPHKRAEHVQREHIVRRADVLRTPADDRRNRVAVTAATRVRIVPRIAHLWLQEPVVVGVRHRVVQMIGCHATAVGGVVGGGRLVVVVVDHAKDLGIVAIKNPCCRQFHRALPRRRHREKYG